MRVEEGGIRTLNLKLDSKPNSTIIRRLLGSHLLSPVSSNV